MDFREIILDRKNDELVQIREGEARVNNLIIHGFPEASEDPEGIIEDIKELLIVIEVEATRVATTRLGKQNDKMRNLNGKEMVMNNSGKLKYVAGKFRRTSLTDDHTAEERETIKSKLSKARNKTEADGEGKYIWKVRGPPQNGLRPVKWMNNKPGGAQRQVIRKYQM